MALDNKLGLADAIELAHKEEYLTKKRAAELYDKNIISDYPVGTFAGLKAIHSYLFQDVYEFAGQLRDVNIAKGNFRFAPVLYLTDALKTIDKMPQKTFEEIVAKYVEMNVAHPFREGNGRSMRIWLDTILKKELGQVIDWSLIDKEDYLYAMERSPVRSKEIMSLLKKALTDKVNDRQVYMKGIDASYRYEGYGTYKTAEVGSANQAD